MEEVCQATNGIVVLGNERFSKELARMLGKRVTRGSAGCPESWGKLPSQLDACHIAPILGEAEFHIIKVIKCGLPPNS